MQKRTRAKRDGDLAVVSVPDVADGEVPSSSQKKRSNMACSTMKLSGHSGAIFSLGFSPDGDHIASTGMDKEILLWNTSNECGNYNVLRGSKSAILELAWCADNRTLVSAAADRIVSIWDANKGLRVRKLTSHKNIVNCCATAVGNKDLFVSGSDDCSIISWDARQKEAAIHDIFLQYQVTAVAMSPDGMHIYAGGIDNCIRRWDVRQFSSNNKSPGDQTPDLVLDEHTDTVSGLALSPDGCHLLSNAMDSTLVSWDVRPYSAHGSRVVNRFPGMHHGAEKRLLRCSWSSDGALVSAGNADRMVHIWNAQSAETLHMLPGHTASVNDVIFHPTLPVIASCSSDKTIFIGEF